MCNVETICPHPRSRQIGLPCLPANVAHADGDSSLCATMKSKHGIRWHGQIRADGKIFWGYNNLGNRVLEMWYSPEAFHRKKENRKAKAKEYRKSPIGKLVSKDTHLKRKFGISLNQYNSILQHQGGKCAICGKVETIRMFKWLAVDHCHKTKRVRGLLCNRCNTCIGKFEDDVALLQKAITYLRYADALFEIEH